MKILIEIFVRSYLAHVDTNVVRDSYHHGVRIPDTDKLISNALSKFDGRILSEEDRSILDRALEFANRNNEPLRIYDVSRLKDKLRAIKHGIRKTPAIIINGEKHEDLADIQQALSK